MTEQNKTPGRRAPVAICDCGMAMAARLIGDRWSLLIIREAFYGVRRFGAMKDDLGIPRAALTDRLNKLVADKILEKVPYQEPGQREHQEYVLTQKGLDLLPVLISLMQWGDKYLRDGSAPPVTLERADTGRKLRAAIVDDDGKEARTMQDIRLVPGKSA